ncbi:hypothetical protein THASP1DRAFT_26132 [Thamnocephalis sphaerospora]|uniref:Secreted protein n=1 Tax=Thamnocephalis sphaerospora TaxID=78915 RepID=A0A4P9XI54_9FUNG|nr:hypothetical protein THASP1DRAFT_26132 [Thamnocephalis sphaerospora]|eukprot:RKP05356.1 hypothetical protein THASP1DRAFT_26132 [Thamnocephalis sphaerospora]
MCHPQRPALLLLLLLLLLLPLLLLPLRYHTLISQRQRRSLEQPSCRNVPLHQAIAIMADAMRPNSAMTQRMWGSADDRRTTGRTRCPWSSTGVAVAVDQACTSAAAQPTMTSRCTAGQGRRAEVCLSSYRLRCQSWSHEASPTSESSAATVQARRKHR